MIGGEELLQQCCDYVGRGVVDAAGTAGRTLPATTGTIGLAYETYSPVRTVKGATHEAIEEDMDRLRLAVGARGMLKDVGFVLAIPVVQPSASHYAPSRVAAVLYVDSRSPGFWLDDDQVRELVSILRRSVEGLETASPQALGRIRNVALCDIRSSTQGSVAPTSCDMTALDVLEIVDPASTLGPFVLNFDHSDLAPPALAPTSDYEPNKDQTYA